jgi:hypothetical protein
MASVADDPLVKNRLYQQAWPVGYRFFQLAFLVDDLHAAAWKWADIYGVGPFHILKRNVTDVRYRGEVSTMDVQIAIAQAGPVQIELIEQKCDTPSLYREIYKRGEGGVHHMATVVKDFAAAKNFYESRGYPAVTELLNANMRVAYFDTRKDFGLLTEVVEEQPGFMAQLARIAETCGAWDGTDPLRILTRDGYRVPEN